MNTQEVKEYLQGIGKAIAMIACLQAHLDATNAQHTGPPMRPWHTVDSSTLNTRIPPCETLPRVNTCTPMMSGQLPSVDISTALTSGCAPPMPTEADALAWEAAQQSGAFTEALSIVHEIETNPAIRIPTPHPLQATDSDVYAIAHVSRRLRHLQIARVSMQAKLRRCISLQS